MRKLLPAIGLAMILGDLCAEALRRGVLADSLCFTKRGAGGRAWHIAPSARKA
jgi:hypothetical protein